MLATRQLLNVLCSRTECTTGLVLKASICHKSQLPPLKFQWPYEKVPYDFYTYFYDPFTKAKMNENSKIIQVEGNVGAGKEDFARRLADELGMMYMPKVDLNGYFINGHGYDYRALNPLLPERLRLCDFELFHENPARHSVIHMQHILYKLRLYQYVKAMQHVMNTGQGVVMARSVFTEKVFVEAMHELGWLPLGYLRGDGVRFFDYKIRYNYIRNLALAGVSKPHLTIYLDRPVDNCMENIKKSPDPMIANSNALTPDFLKAIEESYKKVVLPKSEFYSHVVSYEYPERYSDDEMMDVIDDIKQLNFNYHWSETRFEDWNYEGVRLWHFETRKFYTSNRCLDLFKWLDMHWFDIAGLGDSISNTDLVLRDLLFEGHVGKFGNFSRADADPKVSGYVKSLFNFMNLREQLDRQVYNDYD